MSKVRSVYDDQKYWEWAIDSGYLDEGGVLPHQEADSAVFVNMSIIDHPRNVFDVRWMMLPDKKALLGFLQYVFLPTVFDYLLLEHRQHFELATASTYEMKKYISESNSHWKDQMLALIENVQLTWQLTDEKVERLMSNLTEKFNSTWGQEACMVDFRIFFHTKQIAQFVKQQVVFDEVLQEDVGVSFDKLNNFCENFYTDKLTYQVFMSFLNNRVGCIV